jgi:hypothetical protein
MLGVNKCIYIKDWKDTEYFEFNVLKLIKKVKYWVKFLSQSFSHLSMVDGI